MKHIQNNLVAATLFAALSVGPALADAPVVEIKQAMHKGGVSDGIGMTRIVVDGAGVDRYDKIVNERLDYWVFVNARKPANAINFKGLDLSAGDARLQLPAFPQRPQTYRLSALYSHPQMAVAPHETFSPIQRCNNELAKRSGPQRATFLKQGGLIKAEGAYVLTAVAHWELAAGGIGAVLGQDQDRDFTGQSRADAIIECRPLDRPKPRTQTHTQGAPHNPGTKMEPTLQSVSFKAEPYKTETVAGQQCPTQVRLYGYVQVRRAFNGKLVFFGPHFLSPVTDLAFPDAGQRTIIADYPVKWGNSGGKATRGLMQQLVSLKMNVANDEGKVLETIDRGIPLSCRPTRTPAPPARATGQQ